MQRGEVLQTIHVGVQDLTLQGVTQCKTLSKRLEAIKQGGEKAIMSNDKMRDKSEWRKSENERKLGG
jgi:hypothetical protein